MSKLGGGVSIRQPPVLFTNDNDFLWVLFKRVAQLSDYYLPIDYTHYGYFEDGVKIISHGYKIYNPLTSKRWKLVKIAYVQSDRNVAMSRRQSAKDYYANPRSKKRDDKLKKIEVRQNCYTFQWLFVYFGRIFLTFCKNKSHSKAALLVDLNFIDLLTFLLLLAAVLA